MRRVVELLYEAQRRLYPGDRPSRLARVMNRVDAAQFATGVLAPRRAVTLEVRGRRTGRRIAVPVVVADLDGDRYLVSMLGENVNWVRNVRAAGGRAVLRHGGREHVLLREVDVARRAPVLRRYLHLAPGARPHLPVDRRAPLAEFEAVAARYPVFRVEPAPRP
ncbi:nitroreductase/quinone reductase family protein [Micromonospora purpureochromogenes]|uniref:nitroreductase/quinone reductase family protein n=1 Tax=Micromonospora purpureochromogenes TaxID=47872 RepID=UPI0036431493